MNSTLFICKSKLPGCSMQISIYPYAGLCASIQSKDISRVYILHASLISASYISSYITGGKNPSLSGHIIKWSESNEKIKITPQYYE